MEIIRNEITLSRKHHEKLRKEFPSISRQTIRNALIDVTKSDLAKKIRKRAKAILEKEVKSIKV